MKQLVGRLYGRVNNWVVSNRKLAVGITVLVVALLLVLLARNWYFRTVVNDIGYQQCEVSYGEIVAEWQGDGEDEWNQTDTYYQARLYSLTAHAEEHFFPNTALASPLRISTVGENACRDDIDTLVDTSGAEYRHQGARPIDARLGIPIQDNNKADYALASQQSSNYNPDLSVPVYDGPASVAAVWVSDGGSATVNVDDETNLLWCINDSECDDVVDQLRSDGIAHKGNGYQYVTDNCPDTVECSDKWYEQERPYQYTDLGAIEPFSIELSAVSTWAGTAGAEMIMVFAYPMAVTLSADIEDDVYQLDPGEETEITLDLSKLGPSISGLSIATEGDQPLSMLDEFTLSEEDLNSFNQDEGAEIDLSFGVDSAAKRGECYELSIAVEADYSSGNQAQTQVSLPYCINEPEAEVIVTQNREANTNVRYSYSVRTRGDTSSDLSQFKSLAQATLSDSRGWARTGASFVEVESGGDFTLWLAAPSEMTSFSSGCSPDYSCRVGRDVIINDNRWQNATESWNSAGGSLRDYQHMVVNHEVGHLLGHGHYNCPGEGQLAPVMQQQSIDLGGCQFNPWPLPFEIAGP